MDCGAAMFFTDYSMSPADLGRQLIAGAAPYREEPARHPPRSARSRGRSRSPPPRNRCGFPPPPEQSRTREGRPRPPRPIETPPPVAELLAMQPVAQRHCACHPPAPGSPRLSPSQRPAYHCPPLGIDRVHLKDRLGQIQPKRCNLAHGRSASKTCQMVRAPASQFRSAFLPKLNSRRIGCTG